MNTKNRIKTMLNFGVLAVLMLAVTSGSVSAANISVLSEDFENPVAGDSSAVNTFSKGLAPAGWVKAKQGYNASQNGLNNLGDNQVYSFRYTNSGLTSDVGMIGALEADVPYTISFDVSGDDRNNDAVLELGYTVQLVVFEADIARDDARSSFVKPTNLTILTSKSGNAPEDGSWGTVSFDFAVDPDNAGQAAAVGKDMALRIIGATNSANIDNITVSVPGVDPNLPTVNAGSDWVTWSGEPVVLDDVSVIDNTAGAVTLTYAWSADPADGVVFSATDVESPIITITKPAGDPVTVTFTLACNYVGSSAEDIIDTMTMDVYDDACAASAGGGALSFDSTDFNTDCITDVLDLAQIAMNWLNDYSITASIVK